MHRGGGGLLGGGNIRAAQLEAIKAALLKSLGMLREMNISLCKCWHADALPCFVGSISKQASLYTPYTVRATVVSPVHVLTKSLNGMHL